MTDEARTVRAKRGKAFKTNMAGCARCHEGPHEGIEFKPFTHPPVVAGITHTHWALCPTTGEPILFRTAVMPKLNLPAESAKEQHAKGLLP